jgi:hypothetical protein
VTLKRRLSALEQTLPSATDPSTWTDEELDAFMQDWQERDPEQYARVRAMNRDELQALRDGDSI